MKEFKSPIKGLGRLRENKGGISAWGNQRPFYKGGTI